jgi:hypothetical protein
MIRYSKWFPMDVSLSEVLRAASELGLCPTVSRTVRNTPGGEQVFEQAVFVDAELVREKLGMTEKELEEENE